MTIDDIDGPSLQSWQSGRRSTNVQPGEANGDSFRAYLDPAGHPFCLCWDRLTD